MSTEIGSDDYFLELGDIIKINAPGNKDIDEHVWIIDYLDDKRVRIIHTDTLEEVSLNIVDGQFGDETIESIEILSKPAEKGYARQNGLETGVWISVQIGGMVPVTINGEITNLEEDMIELTTYPDGKKIYIDFAYKGIPLDLPIERIQLFEPPKETLDIPDLEISQDLGGDEPIMQEEAELDVAPPISDVSTKLRQVLSSADEIVFGGELEEIEQYVSVREEQKRYGIEVQVNSLLDDMLSSVPTADRTRAVLNNIHTMIERFKQLRARFSKVTADGVDKPDTKTANYKPLVKRLEKLDKKLYWIMPIVKNKKKLYDVNFDQEEGLDDIDFVPTTLAESFTDMRDIIEEYNQNRVPDGRNKYRYLYERLNPYMTPYTGADDMNDVVTRSEVDANLMAVSDNLEDFYSSVAKGSKVSRCRFVLSGYDKGLTQLHYSDPKKVMETATRVSLTPPDKMDIRGFLTLPEPVLEYSHINLPSTSVLMKAQLNLVPFNYFSILRRSTRILTEELKENAEASKQADEFLDHMKAIMFEQVVDFDDREQTLVYSRFLELMIPKTRILFDLVKKFIIKRGADTSYLRIIDYMEPFLIYPDDITFKQYESIVRFMEDRILELRKTFINGTTAIRSYLQESYNDIPVPMNSRLFGILANMSPAERDTILGSYNIKEPMGNMEVLNNLIMLDNGRLYNCAVAILDKDLMQTIDVEEVVSKAYSEAEVKQEESKSSKSQCENIRLTKYYIDIEELREDDGNPGIYFDERYDPTRYDIADEFLMQKEVMDPKAYRDFLMQHLIKNVGLDERQAEIESEALITKKRRVTQGDYAYTLNKSEQPIYFLRSDDHKWVRVPELDGEYPQGSTMFCNIKKDCLSIKKNCADMKLNHQLIQSELMKEMLEQFNTEFQMSHEQLEATLREEFTYYLSVVEPLKLIELNRFLKNDLAFMKIGDTVVDRDIIVSPYAGLRNKILAQADFVKKQADITAFVANVCRGAMPPDEDQWWFYCTATNTPLLPTFYMELAEAFTRGEYNKILDEVCASRGEKSDDGEKIVDKYSGYAIRTIDYDTSEGYDEAGYRIVSREVLEEDIGNILMQMSYKMPKVLQSPNADMISKVVAALDKNVGINISSQTDFIIKNVTDALKKFIPNKGEYASRVTAARARGKKIPTYEKMYDNALMILTIGYYIVAIQTMIPSVITHRTFPGCIRSFDGYPLDNDGNMSGLRYIICVALKLRSTARPWAALPRITKAKEQRTSDKFLQKVKKFMDNHIVKTDIVSQKVKEKLEYLKQEVYPDDISELFDVRNWTTFLPPLFPVKIKGVSNISANFETVLRSNMSKGSDYQFDQIHSMEGKAVAFSLRIQELIQRVVDTEAPLLKNLADEPLLENACCNMGVRETLRFFTDKESGILKYDKMVAKNVVQFRTSKSSDISSG